MKLLITLMALLAAGTVMASQYDDIEQSNEVVVQVNGELETIEVSDELFARILKSNDPFYFCKNVGDGYRRCSKRYSDRCFGATFKHKSTCISLLDGGPGNRNK